MPKDTQFSRVLIGLRQAQGFATAYAFYQARGAKKVFGLSFTNYLSFERGKSLPQGPRLSALVSALGLSALSPGTRQLLYAYFRDILGSDELLKALASGSPDPAPGSWQVAESATRQAISQRSHQLTLQQYQALADDRGVYACHVVLANTKGWVDKAELSAQVGLSGKALEAALKALKAAGLAELGPGRARSPLAGQYVVPPVITPATAGVYARLQAYRNEWVKGTGKVNFSRYLILRAPEAKFSGYLPHMADVVSMSALYGDVNRCEDSAMYLVEGRVTKLFDRAKG
ncbi:MAG: hypothetical protein HY077_18990 [Elusimicrobia bacterium]|nr:hypothetical protein [Elusimicrobiota bacterium]